MLCFSTAYCLAPPPISFRREVVEVNGKKYEITFDGSHVDIRAIAPIEPNEPKRHYDSPPENPLVITKPNGSYLLKFLGKNWFDFHVPLGQDSFLMSLIHSLGNIGPPPPPGRGGNGDGDGEESRFFPPFKEGDLVMVKKHPELGIGKVTRIDWFQPIFGSPYWFVQSVFTDEGIVEADHMIVYSAPAKSFRGVASS